MTPYFIAKSLRPPPPHPCPPSNSLQPQQFYLVIPHRPLPHWPYLPIPPPLALSANPSHPVIPVPSHKGTLPGVCHPILAIFLYLFPLALFPATEAGDLSFPLCLCSNSRGHQPCWNKTCCMAWCI